MLISPSSLIYSLVMTPLVSFRYLYFMGLTYLPYILQAVGKCFFFLYSISFRSSTHAFPVAFSLAISNTQQRNMVLFIFLVVASENL